MRFAALLVFLLPAIALAEPEAPLAPPPLVGAPVVVAPPAPEPVLPWKIGAGLVFVVSAASTGSQTTVENNGVVPAPGITLAIERLLGRRTWLELGLAGSLSHGFGQSTTFVSNPGLGGSNFDTQQNEDWIYAYGLSLGLRQVLNDRGPVELSIFFRLGVGQSALQEAESSTTSHVTDANANVGLAVERELLPGLAVRIELALIGATFQDTSSGTAADDQTAFGVVLLPTTSLTVQLGF